MTQPPTAALVTLGCARNDVDSEELAARLQADGWQVQPGDADNADVVVVNTCGFVTEAKQESIDTVLAHAGHGRPVVAVGCLAERYGAELAGELPEAGAVIGFDGYADIGTRLRRVVAGEPVPAHEPVDRRTLLPITPVDRQGVTAPPGHGAPRGVVLPPVLRTRLGTGPVAPLKIASGCDRRCSFCAIPSFRGAFVSRPPADVVAEAEWLAGQGVRELVLVSENSTSYGKDLGKPRLLESLLPQLTAVAGITRVRLSYLQPAELRPGLVQAIATTPGVSSYFDLSFQHASGPLLRRMRRFGDAEQFLALLASIRAQAPEAGIRSNVIVGFPGETEADVAVLEEFLAAAELDAVGVFGYSNEDGTEAAALPDQHDADEIAARVDQVGALADLISAGRAAARKGTTDRLLVESVTGAVRGRCGFQGPEDGETTLTGAAGIAVGDEIAVQIVGCDGVDLAAQVAGGSA